MKFHIIRYKHSNCIAPQAFWLSYTQYQSPSIPHALHSASQLHVCCILVVAIFLLPDTMRQQQRNFVRYNLQHTCMLRYPYEELQLFITIGSAYGRVLFVRVHSSVNFTSAG